MIRQADIVIIGGGIWGMSTAFHLARANNEKKIVVVERNGQLADETTRQAAGQIGQLRSDPLMARAVGYTLDLLSRFESETGHDPGFCRSGSLHLALTRERMAAFESQIVAARQLGIEVEIVVSNQISELTPSIDVSQIEGAIYLPNDGYVDAHQCALALGAAAKDLGVEFQFDTHVIDLDIHDDRAVAVLTSQGRIETPQIVVTAGPWTGVVAQMAGITLPMQPIRLQQARTTVDPDLPSNHSVVRIPDRSCYLRPERGGYLYGFFDPEPLAIDLDSEPDGFRTKDIHPPLELIAEARQRLVPIFPVLERFAIDEYRQGMITCTPDASYVIGPTDGIAGLWIATGCGGMGIAGSAAVGRWLARWILEGDPGEDLAPLAVGRFGAKVNDRTWVRQESRRVCANYYALTSTTYSFG